MIPYVRICWASYIDYRWTNCPGGQYLLTNSQQTKGPEGECFSPTFMIRRYFFLSCIIRSIIHHLSSLNDYYKCLSWNMYIPTCSCTLLYFLFYLEWYHQLTSQTFTIFQSFNDRISIHVNIFKSLWRFSCIFNALLSLCCGPKHRII